MNFRLLARVIVATIVGYLVMVLFIALVQDLTFGGIDYYDSSLFELFFAGLGTFLAAVIGGFVAFKIGGNPYPNYTMCILAIVETIYLISAGILTGPLWFEIMASGSLIVGILLASKLQMFFPVKRLLKSTQHRPTAEG